MPGCGNSAKIGVMRRTSVDSWLRKGLMAGGRGLLMLLVFALLAPNGAAAGDGPLPLPIESSEEDDESPVEEAKAASVLGSLTRHAVRRTPQTLPVRLWDPGVPARAGDNLLSHFHNVPRHLPNGLGVPLLC